MESMDFDKLKQTLGQWFSVKNEECECPSQFNRIILLTRKNGSEFRIEWYKNICYFYFNEDCFVPFTSICFRDTFPRVGGNTMSMFLYNGKEYYAVINVEQIFDYRIRNGHLETKS